MNFIRSIFNILTIFIIVFAYSAKAEEQYNGDNFKVILKSMGQYALISFELDDGAILYWRHPGELGLPTKFNLSKSSNLKEALISWPVPELSQKENLTSYVYSKNTDFVIKLIPENTKQTIKLNLNITFSICQKSCGSYDINLSSLINPQDMVPGIIAEALAKTPQKNGTQNLSINNISQDLIDNQHWLNIEFTGDKTFLNPQVFLDLPEYINFEPANFNLISEENKQIIRIPFAINNPKYHAIEDKIYLNLLSDDGNAIEFEMQPIHYRTENLSFIWVILAALLGGLILNVMPCVLPILALKVLQLVKLSGKEKNIIRKSFIAQALGIIVSFIIFALTTYTLQFFGHQVGLGMHFQQPIYLITMAIILSLISINLLSEKEFSLPIPGFINKLLPLNAQQVSIFSFFISGIFSTLLAIPCTAPFVTIAVGFALTANFIEMITVFTAMGIGMALPYLTLATFPKTAKLLPKPGIWMNKFKKFLSVIIFITSLWLIYILSTQLGYRAGIILFLLMIVMKFIINERDFLTNQAKIFILTILIGLSYFLPHTIYLENTAEEIIIEKVWQEYKPEEIPSLVQEGYIVVVDITASWCATCSINKLTTLNNISVVNAMQKFNVIAMRADISKDSNKEVAYLMRLKNHHGVPLTLIYSKKHPQGIVLPTILTPHILISAIKQEI